jgi:hypothetical protein
VESGEWRMENKGTLTTNIIKNRIMGKSIVGEKSYLFALRIIKGYKFLTEEK